MRTKRSAVGIGAVLVLGAGAAILYGATQPDMKAPTSTNLADTTSGTEGASNAGTGPSSASLASVGFEPYERLVCAPEGALARRKPDLTSEVVIWLKHGQEVPVIGQMPGWILLKDEPENRWTPEIWLPDVRELWDTTAVRQAPDPNAATVKTLQRGECVQVIDTAPGWLQLDDGWIEAAAICAYDEGLEYQGHHCAEHIPAANQISDDIATGPHLEGTNVEIGPICPGERVHSGPGDEFETIRIMDDQPDHFGESVWYDKAHPGWLELFGGGWIRDNRFLYWDTEVFDSPDKITANVVQTLPAKSCARVLDFEPGWLHIEQGWIEMTKLERCGLRLEPEVTEWQEIADGFYRDFPGGHLGHRCSNIF